MVFSSVFYFELIGKRLIFETRLSSFDKRFRYKYKQIVFNFRNASHLKSGRAK